MYEGNTKEQKQMKSMVPGRVDLFVLANSYLVYRIQWIYIHALIIGRPKLKGLQL
jgi:hypothetical protein